MKSEFDHKAAFHAAYREAIALSKEAHISKKAQKRFIRSNTWAIYDDCKRNPKLCDYLLKKHGR